MNQKTVDQHHEIHFGVKAIKILELEVELKAIEFRVEGMKAHNNSCATCNDCLSYPASAFFQAESEAGVISAKLKNMAEELCRKTETPE